MRGIQGKSVVLVIIILVGLIYRIPCSQASDIPPWTLTIELEFDKDEYNLSQSRDPITFHGWLNWTGYSAREMNVHLYAGSSLNEVFLSRYDFSFRFPESVPFTGFIPIPEDLNSTQPQMMTISGTVQIGFSQYHFSGTQVDLVVRYWEPEENETGPKFGLDSSPNYPLMLAPPSLLLFFLVFLYIIRRRLKVSLIIIQSYVRQIKQICHINMAK
jgi:hypothetical protein